MVWLLHQCWISLLHCLNWLTKSLTLYYLGRFIQTWPFFLFLMFLLNLFLQNPFFKINKIKVLHPNSFTHAQIYVIQVLHKASQSYNMTEHPLHCQKYQRSKVKATRTNLKDCDPSQMELYSASSSRYLCLVSDQRTLFTSQFVFFIAFISFLAALNCLIEPRQDSSSVLQKANFMACGGWNSPRWNTPENMVKVDVGPNQKICMIPHLVRSLAARSVHLHGQQYLDIDVIKAIFWIRN